MSEKVTLVVGIISAGKKVDDDVQGAHDGGHGDLKGKSTRQ